MARKPKTPPSPDDAAVVQVPELAAPDEAAVPARRGRKARAAALSLASPAAADVGRPAPDAAGTNDPKAGPTKAPGRKPKQAADAETALPIQDGAGALRDQASGQPEAKASLDLTGNDAHVAAVASQAETAADSDPVQQPDRDRVSPANEAAQSAPEAEASAPSKPAAHWDQVTDRVRFDWPAIERVAAEGGPNQAVAKLLVAARAEGARSRWPF